MDIAQEELQFLTIPSLLKESISIPKRSPRTFYLITLSLIFPLSFAILAHSLFTHPILSHLNTISDNPSQIRHEWTLLFLYQVSYLIFLFTFSLLSTAAVVFTVASLYTSKPVSFSSTLAAIPRVFKRLFITFAWVAVVMLLYNLLILILCSVILLYSENKTTSTFLFSLMFAIIAVHVYITVLWHLASVVSVLEPIYGIAAMKQSYELLKGKTRMGLVLVFVYSVICGLIYWAFDLVVVHGGENYHHHSVLVRIVVGGSLVGVLVLVNLVGLLLQSVFYYVCKSYHRQGIDKSALYEHLGGYLGEYVPFKSNIQMENIDV